MKSQDYFPWLNLASSEKESELLRRAAHRIQQFVMGLQVVHL
jgi:hypothetical protein